MMLEVNKRAYMEDGTLRLKSNLAFKRSVRELMSQFIGSLSF